MANTISAKEFRNRVVTKLKNLYRSTIILPILYL